MALVGRLVLLEYDVAGPRVWHERMVLEWVSEENYVVVTPDRDIFMEQLSVLNDDLRSIRVRAGAGAVPPGVNAAEIYPLPAWNPAQLAAIRAEGLQVAQNERALLAPAAAPAAVAAAAPQTAGAPPPHGAGQLKWLAAECACGYEYGAEVMGVAAVPVANARAVHTTANNENPFVMCVDGADLGAIMNRPSRCDPRVLEVSKSSSGAPEASMKDVMSLSKEVEVGWVLSGPRTTKWCLQYLLVEGLGFEGHHERFRQVCKIHATAWGVQEHFQVSMSLRQSLIVDQLDLCNLLSSEIQFRRLQTIEFSYAEKAREIESRAAGGRLSLEEQTSFGGVTRQYATLMICPQLLEHVKTETEREASLAKNLRKAREEREASRKAAAKKKGQPGGAEADP